MARKALGRGLRGLISKRNDAAPETAEAEAEEPRQGLMDLPIAAIVPSPYQPRHDFDEEKLTELAASIREQGLVQAIVVRRVEEDRYELIAGERRLRAVQSLDWDKVPAVVMEASDDKVRELALVENLQRDDLNPLEVAMAYDSLRRDAGLTHDMIAKRIGTSRAAVTNALRLLDLPEEVKGFVAGGQLGAGHARTLLTLGDPLSQIELAKRIAHEALTVREVERIVNPEKYAPAPAAGGAGRSDGAAGGAEAAKVDPFVKDLESRLREHLGTKVTLQDHGGKGRIVVEYYSPGDATRILEAMGLSPDA